MEGRFFVLAPLCSTQCHQQRWRGRGVISNTKKLKVLPREGRFVSMEGRFFVLAPLYYIISPTKTEREGIISNKKIWRFCVEKVVLYQWTFCIYGHLVGWTFCRGGHFVSMDVLYLWTFCREDVLSRRTLCGRTFCGWMFHGRTFCGRTFCTSTVKLP